ncbi:LysR family transcriptional regulator [Allosalinactinospora lopnorensis]|uniref:LysR family transcriptional regulator n=1 Tax=Allosalinactinospora lopnorensis TaxID=1352348 RepID=UPI000623D616|nr:LysR family transcriptional regulator [Allosalinactinospora lopnorensis]
MLDLDRLRALNAIAEYGSVSAAADILGITTSAVSQQIAKLERETSARLLERNGRGVRLTDAAYVLVQHSERILALIAEAEADLEAQRGTVAGRISIAAFATAARGLMPGVLCDVAERHPGLSVRLHELDPKFSLPQVMRGEFDLAVVHDWENSPLPTPDGLDREHLLNDPAEIALPIAHPLAEREALAFSELAVENWIGAPPGDICHAWLRDTLRRSGVEPKVAHYALEYPSQLALVAAGLGIALLPRLGRGVIPPGVVTRPVRPALNRSIYVVWRSEDGRRPAVRAMVDALHIAVDSLEDAQAALTSPSAS